MMTQLGLQEEGRHLGLFYTNKILLLRNELDQARKDNVAAEEEFKINLKNEQAQEKVRNVKNTDYTTRLSSTRIYIFFVLSNIWKSVSLFSTNFIHHFFVQSIFELFFRPILSINFWTNFFDQFFDQYVNQFFDQYLN